jgi:calcineurin-like phosphoesterase family protein
MNTWFTSDWHIGDIRLNMLRRPFISEDEMLFKLKDEHNKLVHPDDTVYVLGDVCFRKAKHVLSSVKDFNGKKILIRGNHDRDTTDEEFLVCFEQVIPDGEGLEIEYKNINFYLTHYPTTTRQDIFNLVGHVHDSWKFQPNMINVGVDVNHFRPVNADEIIYFYNAIHTHFDKDIWAAYLPQNATHFEQRGKKTSYFEKKEI